MEAKNLLKSYYSRLGKEGILKAILVGLAVGLMILFVSLAIWWFFDFKYVLLSIIPVALGVLISSFVSYRVRFRPTLRQTARRVDALGLEERLITMTELENDTGYMAMRQREDAKEALNRANKKMLLFAVPAAMIVSLIVAFVLGSGMITVATLTKTGVIPTFSEIVSSMENTRQYEVKYVSNTGGSIIGDGEQVVNEGESTAAVLAIADHNYVFAGWSDGRTNTYRFDVNIVKNLEIYALFEELVLPELIDDPEEKDIDSADKNPEKSGGETTSDVDSDSTEGEGVGVYKEVNQVIDGKTYYGGNVYVNAEKVAREAAKEAGDGDLVGSYFDIIAKSRDN